jgi:ABC-type antimicrobial peptide transport system permease subunit
MKRITLVHCPFQPRSRRRRKRSNCHAGKKPHLSRRCAPTEILGRSGRHGQKRVARVKYMTGEMLKTAAAVDASLSYLKKEVNPKDLEGCDLRLRAIAPELAAFPVESLRALVRVALAPQWFATGLFGVFAAAAITVTALGLYGLASGYVTSRRAEIAVRQSIGATRQQVGALVARQALIPAILGSTAGAIALTGAGRLFQAWLFETRPTDPGLLVAVPVLIFGLAVIAILGPFSRH